MRLPILHAAIALLLMMLLTGCGGGSASPSPTPFPTQGDTPTSFIDGSQPCTENDVRATFPATVRFGSIEYLTFNIASETDCVLAGPPTLAWYGEDGIPIDVATTRGPVCDSTDHSRCIDEGTVSLFPARFGSVPFGAPVMGPVIISVDHSDQLENCITRPQTAHSLGLAFPDDTSEVRADLPNDVVFGCSPGVRLERYGAELTGSGSGASAFAPNCALDHLAGSYVFMGVALGTAYYEFGISNTGEEECRLSGPPQLHLLDRAGTELGIAYETNAACGSANNDATHCVTNGAIQMLPGWPVPVTGDRDSGQVTVTVAIANSANYNPPCETSFQAQTVGLAFPGTDGDLRMALPADVGVQTCHPQVTLHRFN